MKNVKNVLKKCKYCGNEKPKMQMFRLNNSEECCGECYMRLSKNNTKLI